MQNFNVNVICEVNTQKFVRLFSFHVLSLSTENHKQRLVLPKAVKLTTLKLKLISKYQLYLPSSKMFLLA